METENELIVASSSVDAGISSWELRTGRKHLHYKSCASPPHGLTSVAGSFLASSQVRVPKSSSSGSIQYWSWNKPQVEVKSFPFEPIKPLVSNSQGTYIAGGGISGDIYFWEVSTGKLLKKWHAHYRSITCLVFNDDQSLLISGAEDGCVRVWVLDRIFDDSRRDDTSPLYLYSFQEHSLRVTDIKTGYGGCNAIVVSASEDRTCKVWSLATGIMKRTIIFPSMIDAISLEPGDRVLYVGDRDGRIHIVELNVPPNLNKNNGPYVSLSGHSKAVTCLASSADGFLLVSGSEDGSIRVWDTKTRNIVRVLRHTKGPVNNVVIVTPSQCETSALSVAPAGRRQGVTLPPPLEKLANSPEDDTHVSVLVGGRNSSSQLSDSSEYRSVELMESQIQLFQLRDSSGAAEVDVERLKRENQQLLQMVNQLKKINENQYQFCVTELLDGSHTNARSP